MFRRLPIAIIALGLASCNLGGPVQDFESTQITSSIATGTPTPTAQVTPSPSSTTTPAPSPTLSQEELERLLSTILEDNGGCKFPCWWGITPGISDYKKSREFVQTLATNVIRTTREEVTFLSAVFSVPLSTSQKGELHLTMRRSETGLVDSMSVYGYSISNFPLSEMLTSLGVPSEVRYDSPLWFVSDHVSISLYLFYPDKGLMVKYFSTSVSSNPEEAIEVCNLEEQEFDEDSVGFVFWDASQQITFEQAMLLPVENTYTPRLVEIQFISNFGVTSFYSNFRSENPVCLEIDTRKYAELDD